MGTRKQAPRAKALQAGRPATKRAPRTKAAPLRAEPGPDGRKILSAVKALNDLWPTMPDEREHPLLWERGQRRHYRLTGAAEAASKRIARRAVRTLSGVADLAIALQWRIQNEHDYTEVDVVLAKRLLAIGGLTLVDVDESAWAAKAA